MISVIVGILFFLLLRAIYKNKLQDGRNFNIWLYGMAIFILAYLFRGVWIIIIKTPQYSDYQLFFWVTNQIALSDSPRYLTDSYFHTWAYQVGFPAVMSPLALLFPRNVDALIFVNCAFEASTVACLFSLINRFFNKKTSFILCLLYLTLPFPYMLAPIYTNQLSSVFFLMLGLSVLLAKRKFTYLRCCVAALLFSVSNVLRAEGVLILAAICLLILFHLIYKQKNTKLLQRICCTLPLVACCLLYILSSMLISKIFIWTNLNPNGLKNDFPLYKFVIGLNEKSYGQYSKTDADYFMNLTVTTSEAERDAITKQIILERLSIGPKRLADLLSRKFDVMWTEQYKMYPALAPYSDETVIPILGTEIRVDTIKKIVSIIQSLWLLLLFFLCGLLSVFSFFKKEVSALIALFISFSVLSFGAFSLIEVQKRYSYILMPILFLLAVIAFYDICSRRGKRPSTAETRCP